MSITLNVQGMSCQHCVARVKTALESVHGVNQVEIDLESGNTVVEGEQLDPGVLGQAVIDAGYSVAE